MDEVRRVCAVLRGSIALSLRQGVQVRVISLTGNHARQVRTQGVETDRQGRRRTEGLRGLEPLDTAGLSGCGVSNAVLDDGTL